MDWRIHLTSLLKDTERNLARVHGSHGSFVGLTAKKTPPKFALLRQRVIPGDPHLIVPAPEGSDELIAPLFPPPTPPPPPPQAAAGLPAQQLKEELREVNEQLAKLRQSAAGWQQLMATVAAVDSRCTAAASQLALLGNKLADLQASQAHMQQTSGNSHLEVQVQLAALGTRMDDLAAQSSGTAGARAAAVGLAPLASRLEQAEEGLAALHNRLEQQQAAPTSPSAALAAAVASLQEELRALQGSHDSTGQRQEAQQEELGRVSAKLQTVHVAVAAASKQHAAQLTQFGSQQTELRAARRIAEQQASQIEQLAAQLAGVTTRLLQQPALGAVPADSEAFQQLAGQVQASAAAIEQLQEQAGQLASMQQAVDDANQRLFELRVEFQNATEDGGILAKSTKHQAEMAERQAAEAVDAAADAHKLVSQLERAMERMKEQVAASRQSADGNSGSGGEESGRLARTVDEVAAELAGLKLLLAQQQEVTETAAVTSRSEAAAREERMAAVQSAVAALSSQLEQYIAQGALASAAERTTCLATLSDIVHKQQEELVQVKQGLAAAQATAAAAAGHAVAAEEAVAARPSCPSFDHQLQVQHSDAIGALENGMAGLKQQLAAASAASSEQQTWQYQEMVGMRQQLGAVQEAAAGAAALRQDVSAMQHHLAVVEQGMERRLAECHPALSAMEQRLGELERLTVQSWQQWQQKERDAHTEELRVLQSRISSLESALAGSSSSSTGMQAAAQQQQLALEALQQQVAGMQRQLVALATTSAQQPQQHRQQHRLPPELEQEVDARVHRTEATVASVIEEVATQMAALMERMERAEAMAVSSAIHAQAAAVAQQHAAAVHSMAPAPSLLSSGQQLPQQASTDRSGAGLFCKASLQRSKLQHGVQQQRQQQLPPWQLPSASSAAASDSLSRQSSLQQLQSLSQPQQGEAPQPPPAACQQVSKSGGGSGLFARLSRSFTSQRRNKEAAQESAAAPDAIGVAAAAIASAGPAPAVEGDEGSKVPLRVQYSSSLEQEENGGAVQQGSDAHSAAISSQRSRRNNGAASGGGTPRRQSSGVQPSSGAPKFTPRSRQASSASQAVVAALQGERSGGSSTLRQGTVVGNDSSFGYTPLSQGSSYLVYPREDVDECIRHLRTELEDPSLDEVQREVLQSDLERMLERAAQGR